MEDILNEVAIEKYSDYKNSGVEWLGDFPTHWKLTRANYIFKTINQRSSTGEEELLSVSEHHGVRPRSESNVSMFMAESYEGHKICDPGDLVINSLWAWSRGLGFSKYKGIVSTAYSVFRPNHNRYDQDYLNYLLRIEKYVAQYLIASKGIWISRLQLSDWSFLRLPILTPPKEEQIAIARFLDTKTALIDRAIAIKEKQIELLKERKQTLVHDAVSRGLNRNVKIKKSGIESIHYIPAHWQVKKLKYISEIHSGITLGKTYSSKNVRLFPYLRVANVQYGHFKLDDIAYLHLPLKEAEKYFVKKGDILVTEGGDLDKLGRGTVWNNEIKNCLHQNHVFAVRVDLSIVSPTYASILMESHYGREYFTRTANKTTNLASTNSTKLGNFPLVLPPQEEMQVIQEYIKKVDTSIQKTVSTIETEISKLKEYKTTLINNAVTGKIKVT